MKKIIAFMVAVAITGLVALGVLAIGWDAFSASSVSAAESTASVPLPADSTGLSARVRELESLVSQYQQRETEYKTQLDQANQQVQQYQQILDALQQRGLIRVTEDGQITVGRRGFEQEGE